MNTSLYKIYQLNDNTFSWYRKDTKRGKNCTKECVERKLTALMLCAVDVLDNGLGCKTYKFGTFNISVREDSNEIGIVYWSQKALYVSPEKSELLHKCYTLMGLSEDGQEIIGEIDDKALTEFCVENNLSNTREYKSTFLDVSHVLD